MRPSSFGAAVQASPAYAALAPRQQAVADRIMATAGLLTEEQAQLLQSLAASLG